jgi:hypothetical protein
MEDDNLSPEARILELEKQLVSAQASLRAEAQNHDVLISQYVDNLRSMEQANAVQREEIENLRARIRGLSNENDGLKITIDSASFAKHGQFCVTPNLGKKEVGIQGNVGFIVMPFSQNWSDPVHNAVARAFYERGMECKRADQLNGRSIILDVWTSICECAVMVVDITGRNPNVMYELGLAEAIGKRVLLISQTTDPRDLAFDILGTRLLLYSQEALPKLTSDLTSRLRPGHAGS